MKYFLNKFNDIQNLKNLLKQTQYNNYLLIPIKVLKHIKDKKYRLMIGTKEITTTSYIDLMQGVQYWAELSSDKSGGVKLSNLKMKPLMMQGDKFPIAFDSSSIDKILGLDDCATFIKKTALQSMQEAHNKHEFDFAINLLDSISKGIITIPYLHNQNYHIIQIAQEKEIIKFFITLNNIGILSGEIFSSDNENYNINIYTFFKNGHKSIKEKLKEILKSEFKSIDVIYQENISPLYEFKIKQSVQI